MPLTVFCTYCSARKNPAKSPIRAIERYISKRINSVAEKAKSEHSKFMIFSGKYGLIGPDQTIPDYNHLLMPKEIETHSSFVAKQIKEKKIEKILFYVGDTVADKNIKTYAECASRACEKAHIDFEIRRTPINE
jgi:hypothetical protein